MPTRGLLLALPALALFGCPEAEPFVVPLQLSPETLELPPARYDQPPPFAAYQLRNVSGTLLFVTPAPPQGDRPDLLDIGFPPYTELLPDQRLPVEIAMDSRRWRWETGSFSATMLLEGSYFFSGQPLDEPENPRTNRYPERIAAVYELPVSFSINCDLDGDGDDATQCAGTDCDDRNESVNVAGVEVCNGVDDDCDGATDENAIDEFDWWLDNDADGYGDPATLTSSCDRPSNSHIDNGDDCDDNELTHRPGATELCNDNIDNDCDGEIDEIACN